MAKPMPKNTAPNANPTTEGKAPVAPVVDLYSDVLDALANAGSARGAAVDAVCAYLNHAHVNHNDVLTMTAINDAVKIAKLTKIAKIVGAALAIIKIGGSLTFPSLNPVDYK